MIIWDIFKKFINKHKKILNWENEDYKYSFNYYVNNKVFLDKTKNFKDSNVQKLYSYVKTNVKELYWNQENDNIDYKDYYVVIDAWNKNNSEDWTRDYITLSIKDKDWKEYNSIKFDYNSIPCWNEEGMNTIEVLWNKHSITVYTRETYLLFLAYFLDKLNDKWKVDFSLLTRLLSMVKDKEDVINHFNQYNN